MIVLSFDNLKAVDIEHIHKYDLLSIYCEDMCETR